MSEADVRSSLSPEAYLRERVDDQLRWYEAKSASHKRWYYRLQLVTLVFAVTVPIVALSSSEAWTRYLTAISGAIAALSAGVGSLYQLREQWLDYRSTAEALKYERFRFLAGAEPYVDDGSFSRFVNRVESIIISENMTWRTRSFEHGLGDEGEAEDREAERGSRSGAKRRDGRFDS